LKPPPPQQQRDQQKLFQNMAFAISFQSRKPGESNEQYAVRTDFSATIQKLIRQAGGRILENGFDELFDVAPLSGGGGTGGTPASSDPTSSSTPAPADLSRRPRATTEMSEAAAANDDAEELSLTPEGRATGFTALIADGHSRKVKYMQALALGLPCLAARWVTACLDRGTLVDWSPYLLCAGQSAFLGDAIRSRCLPPPGFYDASAARLPAVVRQRARLLRGSRILAVVRRAAEAKKMAYVFLARVLGASLTRVHTVEEARAEMREAERVGRAFDWVYADGKAEEEALFAGADAGAAAAVVPAGAGGKKRKRVASTAMETGGPAAGLPVKRIRTLSDELVIQSLILGRLIEEGEMDG
jgi:hypothetical protein